MAEERRYILAEKARPLNPKERLGNVLTSLRCSVHTNRNDERDVARDHLRALLSEAPLQTEVPFPSRVRVRRNNRDEERAVTYLAADLLVPHITTAQVVLIEPDLDAGASERAANAACRLDVL